MPIKSPYLVDYWLRHVKTNVS